MKNSVEKFGFFGLHLSSFSLERLRDYIFEIIDEDQTIIAYGHALWSIPMMKRYPEIYYYGDNADLLVCDGRLLYLIAQKLNFSIGEELSIPSLVKFILALSFEKKISIMLFGADEKTNSLASENIKHLYPNIEVKPGVNGYFKSHDEETIVDTINQNKPNILLVGISSPFKEVFSSKYKNKLKTNIIIPCGGMIDVLAGKTKQTPPLLKKLGLASLYRVTQEPNRLVKRYIFIYGFLFFGFYRYFSLKLLLKKIKIFPFLNSVD